MNRLACLALLLLLGSCVAVRRVPGVIVASDPPGARIVVDGKDTGYVTPFHLGLDRDPHTLTVELDGYAPSVHRINTVSARTLIFYDEAYIWSNTWRFPLWLNVQDGLAPIKIERGYRPSRIFVRLRLAGTQ